MKKYDFKKAKALIKKHKDTLKEAALGMHEDWFWTAETIWTNGKYTRKLPDSIAGITGSNWATPTLELVFQDGTRKMVECSAGETKSTRPVGFMLGVFYLSLCKTTFLH